MSRECCCYNNCCRPAYGNINNCGSGGCNFPSFIILILILLQFKSKGCQDNGCCDNGLIGSNCGAVDKGILFIIALYYLSCCNPCARRNY